MAKVLTEGNIGSERSAEPTPCNARKFHFVIRAQRGGFASTPVLRTGVPWKPAQQAFTRSAG
ncbi:hypothetical protein, partial [Streptomyces nigra]|uniref:hypothetical protein n=1 Tax=Streptomyces nigra TaxID=1827580 RepID=UPI003814A9AE